MKLGSLKADLAKVEQGVWIDNIPDMGDLRLRVRPSGNPDYRRLYNQLVDATPRGQKPGGLLDFDVRQQINARVLADTVLLDWDRLEDDAGQPVPFSPDRAKELLLDPTLVAFRDAVAWAAQMASDMTTGTAEDSRKN